MCLLKFKAVSLALLFALTACNQPPSAPLRVNVGNPFPELKVSTLSGEPASTQQFAGKALVVNVWATWCGPCRRELPSLQRLANTLDPQRFAVIGVSIDSDDHLLREFLIDRKVTFPNFHDAQMTVASQVLGLRAYPSTFLVSADGIVRRVVERAEAWDSENWRPEILALANPG